MAYSYYRQLTIDHTQCGSSDSSSFPAVFVSPSGTVNTVATAVTWVSGTTFPAWLAGNPININGSIYTVMTVTSSTAIVLTTSAGTQTGVAFHGTPWLATAANGGRVQNTTTQTGGGASITVPADVVWGPNSNGTSPWAFEYETYSPTTGDSVVWINISTLTHSSNTILYCIYDNSSVTTWQGNVTGVWDAYYVGVYHMATIAPVTYDTPDSTSNGNTAVDAFGTPSTTTGVVDGAIAYLPSTGAYSVPSGILASGNVTIELWFQTNSTSNYYGVISFYSTDSNSLEIFVNGTTDLFGGNYNNMATSGTIAANTWTKADLTGIVGGATQFYLNGNVSGTPGTLNFATRSVTGYLFGRANSYSLLGPLDEVRLSSGIARSSDWLLASYNNQLNPCGYGGFISVGGETPIGVITNSNFLMFMNEVNLG